MKNATPNEADATPLIVIANDQEWTARAVESILESAGYRVAHAYTAREVLRTAAETDPDLLILDQQLPDFSGSEVCQQIRADPRFGALLPIIITTAGPSGRPQRLNAYAAGAWEFYGQPLDAEALLHKIQVYVAAYREARKLRRAAMYDEVSGLYNRRGFARRATELIAEARRMGMALACVAWSFPVLQSAEALRGVTAAFRASGRAADTLADLGGGTLALVAPGTTSANASLLDSRMRRILAGAAGNQPDGLRSAMITADAADDLPADGGQLLEQVTLKLAS